MNGSEVQLRWLSIGGLEGRFADLETGLSPDERARAARFRVAEARRRFVAGRALLRRTLGATLGVDPASLVLGTGERGKPELVEPRPPALGFNLAHSGGVVVVAVARTAVGVDVEVLRPIGSAERLARRFFSTAETAVVLARRGADRDLAFLRVWTQKEAYLKARGLGVGMPLAEVETEPEPTRPPRLVAVSGDRVEAARWSLVEIAIPGAVCTIAIAGPVPTVDLRRIASPGDLHVRTIR
jgi:4'-phosphopantetheinyl transferase